MKERFKFECFKIYDEQKGLEMQYFKIKQELTWQFYIRPVKLWFEPCSKCQDVIEKEYADKVAYGYVGDLIYFPMQIFAQRLCKQCKKYVLAEIAETWEVILGNKDYEPTCELSRKWLDDEDSRIRISIEDYTQRNEQAKSIDYEEEKQKYQ